MVKIMVPASSVAFMGGTEKAPLAEWASAPHLHQITEPKPFDAPEVGGALRLAHGPLVVMSTRTGSCYRAEGTPSGISPTSHFDGVVVRCREVFVTQGGAFVPAGSPPACLKILRRDEINAASKEQGRPLGHMHGEDPYAEIAALQLLNADGGHEHLEQFIDAVEDGEFLYKIAPWYGGGDAFSAAPMREDDAKKLMRELLSAVAFLHAHGVVHRDISLENILFETDGERHSRLCDLGIALRVPRDGSGAFSCRLSPQGCCGKPTSMSPEVAVDAPFDPFAADVFSCGTALYMLLLGVAPWQHVGDNIFRAISVDGRLAPLLQGWGLAGRCSGAAVDLLQGMLLSDPSKRLSTVEAVLAHPWFTGGQPTPTSPIAIPPLSSPSACFSNITDNNKSNNDNGNGNAALLLPPGGGGGGGTATRSSFETGGAGGGGGNNSNSNAAAAAGLVNYDYGGEASGSSALQKSISGTTSAGSGSAFQAPFCGNGGGCGGAGSRWCRVDVEPQSSGSCSWGDTDADLTELLWRLSESDMCCEAAEPDSNAAPAAAACCGALWAAG